MIETLLMPTLALATADTAAQVVELCYYPAGVNAAGHYPEGYEIHTTLGALVTDPATYHRLTPGDTITIKDGTVQHIFTQSPHPTR